MTMRSHLLLLKIPLLLLAFTETIISQKFDPEKEHSRYYESVVLLKQNGYCPLDFNELIGHGIYGEVWGSTDHNQVIKVRRVSGPNPERHESEFKKQLYIYNCLQICAPDLLFQERASTLKPENFAIIQDPKRSICLFTMERLYPIPQAKNNELTRIQLADSLNKYQEIESLVNAYPAISNEKTNMEQLCYDLGTLFAILQLGAKMDGFDTELYLARQSQNSDHYKIVLIDFHLTRNLQSLFISKSEKKLVSSLLRGIHARKTNPTPLSPGFEHFKAGYFNVALVLDQQANDTFYTSLTQQLFNKYIMHATKKTNLCNT